MRNVLICPGNSMLSAWFLVLCGTGYGTFKRFIPLLEEVHQEGWALRAYSLTLVRVLVLFVSFVWLRYHLSASCSDCLLPLWKLWNRKPK